MNKSENKNNYKTEQEAFWAGEFGNEYVERNQGEALISSNVKLYSQVFSRMAPISSVIEFGCNRGLNLQAIRRIFPDMALTGIDINRKALDSLEGLKDFQAINQSILEVEIDQTFDLSIISGVLIHINPDHLPTVYGKLYQATHRYLFLNEYYNPTPVEIPYRGHQGRLFKRDFAGEMLDLFPDLKLMDYGFCYHRDPSFPSDDTNWFLFEQRS